MTAPATPGVVFDSVVLLQAAISSKGPSHACVTLLDTGRIVAFISPEVLAEITDVLNRPKLRQRFKALTSERPDGFLRNLSEKAICLQQVPAHFTYSRDPDDEPYLNLAITAGARYVLTWDNDLLDLMKDNPAELTFATGSPACLSLRRSLSWRKSAPNPSKNHALNRRPIRSPGDPRPLADRRRPRHPPPTRKREIPLHPSLTRRVSAAESRTVI